MNKHWVIKLTRLFSLSKDKKALNKDENCEILKAQGQIALNNGDIDDAIEKLRAAKKIHPNDGITLGLLAVALSQTNFETELNLTIKKAMSASTDTIRDFVTIGGWLLGGVSPSSESKDPKVRNWLYFRQIAHKIVDAARDSGHLVDLCYHSYHARQLGLALIALEARYQEHPNEENIYEMLIDTSMSVCDFSARATVKSNLIKIAQDKKQSSSFPNVDPYSLQSIGMPFDIFNLVCKQRSDEIAQNVEALNYTFGNINPSDKIRVGFLLPYTWFSSINLILNQVVGLLDREKFVVLGYSIQTSENGDDFETEYISKFDQFSKLLIDDTKSSAEIIGADSVDVLLDTTGHTRTNCLKILAHRPAPVQAHYLGYNNTIGADFIDYLFTDTNHFGSDVQKFKLDNLANMPGGAMIYASKVGLKVKNRSAFSLPKNKIIFCCFNHSGKIDPEVFSAWMKILNQLPESVLVLSHWNIPEVELTLHKEARQLGIGEERILFLPPIEHNDHMQRLATCDIALDTLYHGGGVTTLDALWAEVPVISVKPSLPLPHNGSSFLSAVGLEKELVTENLDKYVELAVRLASDPKSRLKISKKIACSKENSPIFDVQKHVVSLEVMLEQFCKNHNLGKHSDIISLN